MTDVVTRPLLKIIIIRTVIIGDCQRYWVVNDKRSCTYVQATTGPGLEQRLFIEFLGFLISTRGNKESLHRRRAVVLRFREMKSRTARRRTFTVVVARAPPE